MGSILDRENSGTMNPEQMNRLEKQVWSMNDDCWELLNMLKSCGLLGDAATAGGVECKPDDVKGYERQHALSYTNMFRKIALNELKRITFVAEEKTLAEFDLIIKAMLDFQVIQTKEKEIFGNNLFTDVVYNRCQTIIDGAVQDLNRQMKQGEAPAPPTEKLNEQNPPRSENPEQKDKARLSIDYIDRVEEKTKDMNFRMYFKIRRESIDINPQTLPKCWHHKKRKVALRWHSVCHALYGNPIDDRETRFKINQSFRAMLEIDRGDFFNGNKFRFPVRKWRCGKTYDREIELDYDEKRRQAEEAAGEGYNEY